MRSDSEGRNLFSESFSNEQVNIYMRNVRKEARLINLICPAKASQLLIIAASRFNLPPDRILLFYNGFRIDNYDLPLTLTDRSIVHLIDTRNLEPSQLLVSFRPLGWNTQPFKLTLSSQSLVHQVVVDYLVDRLGVEHNKFFLVYLGKTLTPTNTLREEFVEDESEITIVPHKPPRNTYLKESYDFNNSYHVINQSGQSQAKINCPVTYLTSLSAIKKKNQQQSALQQMQSISAIAPAAPVPHVNPYHFMNESFASQPPSAHPMVSSAIVAESVDPTTPIELHKHQQSNSSSNERAAPKQDSNGEPNIHITTQHSQPLLPSDPKGKKILLQLQSNYHTLNNKDGLAHPHGLSDIHSEVDSFYDAHAHAP